MVSGALQYAIFRKRDSDDYPEPFDTYTFSTRAGAQEHMRANFVESAWKWLEIRKRPAPAQWTRCDEL